MGLAERKFKQRIGHDPRNLTWSDDKDRFSYKHMSNLGWSENSGIGGSNLSGNPNHIVVARKLDNSGIGMGRAKKEGDEMAGGAGPAGQGLDDVLRRLAEASRSGTTTPVEAVVEIKAEAAPARNRIASRQKHLHSKRLASSSPAALAEILGVPISSLTPSVSPSPAPVDTSSVSDSSTPQDPARTAEETISTSTLSVSDYFRQKLREKMLARQSASDLPEGSLARVKEEVKVAVGGVEWEGSRTTFAEVKQEEDVKPAVNEATVELVDTKEVNGATVELVDEKEAKRLAKEERRRQKEDKRKRKEEKRARKGSSGGSVKAEHGSSLVDVKPSVADLEETKPLKKRKREDPEGSRRSKKEKSTT